MVRLRELILTLAVQGKLVPQDPADEPASVLLQKIRAEKDRLIAEGKIKRDMPLAEIEEEEKPFVLPTGWEWGRLGELVNLTYGKNLPTTSLTEDGFQVFGANGVIGRYSEYLYESEQLLISCRGAYSGKPNISPKKCFVTNNSIVCEFVARSMADLDFFYRQLQIADKSRLVTGSAQPQVTIANADPLVLAVPPLAEQSRIVTRVEELMRLCDALEAKGKLEAAQHGQLVSTLLGTLTASATPQELAEHWQRVAQHFDLLLDRPEAIDALEQTLLQLAVRGLLVSQDPTDEPANVLLSRIRTEKDRLIVEGKIKRDKSLPPIADEEKPFELPVGWEWVRVGNIGITRTGGTPASNRPEFFDGNFPFIGPGQITLSGKILTPEKFISETGRLECAVAEPGDILMVCIGGSIGKSGAATYATAFNQQINSLHPLLALNAYVLSAMTANDFVVSVIDASAGSATPIISKGKWDFLLVPMPPLAEQSRIISRLSQMSVRCANLRQRLTASQSTQSRLVVALFSEVVAS